MAPISGGSAPCGRVSQYYNPTPQSWQHANTDGWLNAWWTAHAAQRTGNSNGFTGAFGEWALGEPDWSCQISGNENNCNLNPCDNQVLNGLGNGTQQAYYVAHAISNLHGYIRGLEDAFQSSAISSSYDQDAIVNNFWWDDNNWDPTVLKEVLGAIGTILGLGAAFAAPAIATEVGAVSALYSGATGAANTAISQKDITFNTAADMGHAMSQFVLAGETAFISLNNALMHGDGIGNSADIRQVLQNGRWVNITDMDMKKTVHTMMSMMQSAMINYLWRMQRVFILGGASCGEDQGIGGTGSKNQDNIIWWCDNKGKAWYLFYWQKHANDQDTADTNTDNGWIARPWGSDRMGNPPYLETTGGSGPFWKNLNPSDAVISSVKAYQVAGNNYTTSTWNKRMQEIFSTGVNPWSEGTAMEGLWTIPVCDISATVGSDYDYAYKQYILQPYGYNNKPKWCGPICGNDPSQTIAFYQKANFGKGFSHPFLDDCSEGGKTWDWQTGDISQGGNVVGHTVHG
ncbi:hypothetical protein EYZ11_009367 [Aspergillus tanneri]|uniref:DUF7872 domain-containing protein n=1 Tax=Aspergillus tanneri TaxID=1220188 RepID=A0A4S3JA81_9EURO|nr:hypothetical protein EYZ11_009367 [Aspergillus tanneri]